MVVFSSSIPTWRGNGGEDEEDPRWAEAAASLLVLAHFWATKFEYGKSSHSIATCSSIFTRVFLGAGKRRVTLEKEEGGEEGKKKESLGK